MFFNQYQRPPFNNQTYPIQTPLTNNRILPQQQPIYLHSQPFRIQAGRPVNPVVPNTISVQSRNIGTPYKQKPNYSNQLNITLPSIPTINPPLVQMPTTARRSKQTVNINTQNVLRSPRRQVPQTISVSHRNVKQGIYHQQNYQQPYFNLGLPNILFQSPTKQPTTDQIFSARVSNIQSPINNVCQTLTTLHEEDEYDPLVNLDDMHMPKVVLKETLPILIPTHIRSILDAQSRHNDFYSIISNYRSNSSFNYGSKPISYDVNRALLPNPLTNIFKNFNAFFDLTLFHKKRRFQNSLRLLIETIIANTSGNISSLTRKYIFDELMGFFSFREDYTNYIGDSVETNLKAFHFVRKLIRANSIISQVFNQVDANFSGLLCFIIIDWISQFIRENNPLSSEMIELNNFKHIFILLISTCPYNLPEYPLCSNASLTLDLSINQIAMLICRSFIGKTNPILPIIISIVDWPVCNVISIEEIQSVILHFEHNISNIIDDKVGYLSSLYTMDYIPINLLSRGIDIICRSIEREIIKSPENFKNLNNAISLVLTEKSLFGIRSNQNVLKGIFEENTGEGENKTPLSNQSLINILTLPVSVPNSCGPFIFNFFLLICQAYYDLYS